MCFLIDKYKIDNINKKELNEIISKETKIEKTLFKMIDVINEKDIMNFLNDIKNKLNLDDEQLKKIFWKMCWKI